LFFMNDATVLSWLKPEGDTLAARLNAQQDSTALAEELYLAMLSRMPTDEEKVAVTEHLAARADRRETAVRNLIWSLLASTEFCANH
jgi:hypothetical protein